jgi:multisubunit Na+/H+ antiporter MnhB subunit
LDQPPAPQYFGSKNLSRDLRNYARKTNVRLAAGAIILLFVIGLGLIYLIYGKEAAGLGFFCLLAALTPVALILVVFYLLDWMMKRAGRE